MTYTISQEQITALVTALQSHINAVKSTLAPLTVIESLDQKLVASWQAFEKSLIKVEDEEVPAKQAKKADKA